MAGGATPTIFASTHALAIVIDPVPRTVDTHVDSDFVREAAVGPLVALEADTLPCHTHPVARARRRQTIN